MSRPNLYGTPRWFAVRNAVRRRDRGKCQRCGAPGRDVHHKRPVRSGGAVFDLANLELLCVNCHADEHRLIRMKRQSPASFAREQWFRDSVRELGGKIC